MSLRNKLQGTATRLISKYGDKIQKITITTTSGVTAFDQPTITKTTTPIDAVVTGAGKWADGETILHSDLRVLVSGSFPLGAVGDKMEINGNEYTITMRNDILATGVKSAVIYFVRR